MHLNHDYFYRAVSTPRIKEWIMPYIFTKPQVAIRMIEILKIRERMAIVDAYNLKARFP